MLIHAGASGADLVIDNRAQDFATEIKSAGEVDLILDTVGGDYLVGNQRCLNADGLIIVIGLLRGIEAQLNLGLMLVKRQRIQGSALRSQLLAKKAQLTQALRDYVLPRFTSGEFKVTVDRTFPIKQAQAAHQYLAENRNCGKVVLVCGGIS